MKVFKGEFRLHEPKIDENDVKIPGECKERVACTVEIDGDDIKVDLERPITLEAGVEVFFVIPTSEDGQHLLAYPWTRKGGIKDVINLRCKAIKQG